MPARIVPARVGYLSGTAVDADSLGCRPAAPVHPLAAAGPISAGIRRLSGVIACDWRSGSRFGTSRLRAAAATGPGHGPDDATSGGGRGTSSASPVAVRHSGRFSDRDLLPRLGSQCHGPFGTRSGGHCAGHRPRADRPAHRRSTGRRSRRPPRQPRGERGLSRSFRRWSVFDRGSSPPIAGRPTTGPWPRT